MVQVNPVPVFGAKKNTNTIWRKFFTEILVQIVSAQGFPSILETEKSYHV